MSLIWELGFELKWKMLRYLKIMLIVLMLFCWWTTFAENDLLYETIEPSKELIIFQSKSSKRIGNRLFGWSKEVDIEGGGVEVNDVPNLFGGITQLLLWLVVVLSVTMILYNWIKYIVKVWQWEDSKSLMKNVVYIIVWILVSLFSVVIITLLRSVPTSLEYDGDGGGIPMTESKKININNLYEEDD